MSDPESRESIIEELLIQWEEARENGQDIPVEKLCHNHPELAHDLAKRICDLRTVDRRLYTPDEETSRRAPSAHAVNFRGNKRFEILRHIGSGGMGDVYAATDRVRQEEVALKVLPRAHGQFLYRFKQEFRSLASVRHPNLIRLHELIAEDGVWFFTMELIDGVNLLEYVRGGASAQLSLGRLKHVLTQLADGVSALHATDRIHRDLKPSNLLVSDQGRVVVLDFGLVSSMDRPEMQRFTSEDSTAGTFAYMAPEQANGTFSPMSDWYSVGAILYECITGQLPHHGTLAEMLLSKQSEDPRYPGELARAVPSSLCDLCMKLLRRDPNDRGNGADIQRDIAELPGLSPRKFYNERPLPDGSSCFIGRRKELEQLDATLESVRDGHPMAVFLEGESGSGKTALIAEFKRSLISNPQKNNVVVLSSRCYEQESVPFKALDGVVDSVARYLRSLPSNEILRLSPRRLDALVRVFPVLKSVKEFDTFTPTQLTLDTRVLRRTAFTAFEEMLRRLGDRCRIVLCIDDLQWGDEDSAQLIHDVLNASDPPPILLVVAYRGKEVNSNPRLGEIAGLLASSLEVSCSRRIVLPPLSHQESAELVMRLADLPNETAESIASESRGSPYLTRELTLKHRQSTSQAATIDEVIAEHLACVSKEALEFCRLVAVAGIPVSLSAASGIANLREHARTIDSLRSHRLVRTFPGGSDTNVECYHDRVRETVIASIETGDKQRLHGALAEAFRQDNAFGLENVASHFERAGRLSEAGDFYARAATEAVEKLAFHHAAQLLAKAREFSRVEHSQWLTRQRADALAACGQAHEAALEYRRAAEAEVDREHAITLQLKSASQSLISGRIDEGIATMRPVLAHCGLIYPATSFRAAFRLLIGRAQRRIRRHYSVDRGTDGARAKLALAWEIIIGLSMVDPLRAFGMLTEILIRPADGSGLTTRFELLEVAFMATGGESSRSAALNRLSKIGSIRGLNQYELAFATLVGGMVEHLTGNWSSAERHFRTAEEQFLSLPTTYIWELNTLRTFWLWNGLWTGDFRLLAEERRRLSREASGTNDLFLQTYLDSSIAAWELLACDRPQDVRPLLEKAEQRWTQDGFYVQHHNLAYSRIMLAIYEGRSEAAFEQARDYCRQYKASYVIRIMDVRLMFNDVYAKSAIAAAKTSSSKYPLKVARRLALTLSNEKDRRGGAFGASILAAVAMLEGNKSAAMSRYELALSHFDALGMQLHEKAARRALAYVQDDMRTMDGIDAELVELGVVNPQTMCQLVVPTTDTIAPLMSEI